MASRVCLNDPAAYPLHPNLEVLARNLERDTVRCKRLIRQFLDDDRAAFLRGAVNVLKKQADTAGARYLIGLLLESALLLPALCDTGLSLESALEMARVAITINPVADILLGRALAESLAEPGELLSMDSAGRMMEILGEISDGNRLFPSLVRLLRHGNANLRSKAVLMIGRGNQSAKWVRHRLADTDPRIRANALEALWGVNTDEARQLLESLVHDANNRVAGNAILGLYRLGDSSIIPELVAMARHESAMFRATAAWVMGETGDPRFTEVLAGLLRDPNSVLRKRAFAALGCIRTAISRSGQAAACRLAARVTEPEGQRGTRRVLLAAAGESGGPAPPLLPTQILLNEDGQMVNGYRVTERPLPETMSIVFLLPWPAPVVTEPASMALQCLPWKRPSDLWACSYYTPEPPAPPLGELNPPHFQTSADAIAAEFQRVPPRPSCSDLWHAIWHSVEMETGPVIGQRQLIIFAEGPVYAAAGEDLIAAVAAAHAAVHVISSAPAPALATFCRRVNGTIWDSAQAIDAYLSQLAVYEITYQPPAAGARTLKIRLHGPSARGEMRVSLP